MSLENNQCVSAPNSTNKIAFYISLIAILISIYFWKKVQNVSKIREDKNQIKKEPEKVEKADMVAEKKLPTPKKWLKIGHVSKLIIYPIKSCSAVALEEAQLTRVGLKCSKTNIQDRNFMVVDENGKEVTMKKIAKMALIKFEVDNDKITVKGQDMPQMTFTYPTMADDSSNLKSCKIYDDPRTKALDCGDEVSQWFQEFLGDSTLRLVYHHLGESQKKLNRGHQKLPMFRVEDMGTFQNETSYMLCAQESIVEVNKYLEKESTWLTWRPNILIEGVLEPFAEINCSYIKIGDGDKAILKHSRPCQACKISTVDDQTGEYSRDGEPLKTLRKINRGDIIADEDVSKLFRGEGLMGAKMGLFLPDQDGEIVKIGDPVYAALL